MIDLEVFGSTVYEITGFELLEADGGGIQDVHVAVVATESAAKNGFLVPRAIVGIDRTKLVSLFMHRSTLLMLLNLISVSKQPLLSKG